MTAVKHHPKYKRHVNALSSRHPKLKALITAIGPMQRQVPAWNSINDAMFHTIVSQMLSSSSARAIKQRLLEKFKTPDRVIQWAMKQPVGPAMGLSRNKVKALGEWGKFIKKNKGISKTWNELPYLEYKKEVAKIWGLGAWSADMIAIFHLGRMDVWPAGDAGVVKGAKIIFGSADYAKISPYIRGSETLACLYLWEMLNQKIRV